MKIRLNRSDAASIRRGAFCRIEYEPDPQIVINDRADYCAWRISLEALAEALSGRLETITALAPAAALFSWTGELDGDRPRDLFVPGAERFFTGAQERELEGAALSPRATAAATAWRVSQASPG